MNLLIKEKIIKETKQVKANRYKINRIVFGVENQHAFFNVNVNSKVLIYLHKATKSIAFQKDPLIIKEVISVKSQLSIFFEGSL